MILIDSFVILGMVIIAASLYQLFKYLSNHAKFIID